MTRPRAHAAPARSRRLRAGVLLAALAAGAGAGCNEDFITGPRDRQVRLELAGWADTLVLGDVRALRVRVLDASGREVLDAPTQVDVAAPALLGSRLNAAGPAAGRLAVPSAADSVTLAPTAAGTSGVVVTLLDPRFTTTELRRQATVVVAGVRVDGPHAATLTALDDTLALAAAALARQGSGGAADLLPVPGLGVTWTRRGPGAVRLVGTGEAVRVVAEAPGTDTLVAAHAQCLAGGRCADTVLVRVDQTAAPLAHAAGAYRAWSLGDSVTPQAVVQDARGYAIAGARLELAPLTAADSAVVGVNTAAGVPALARAPLAATLRAGVSAPPAAAPASRPVPARVRPLRIVARGAAAGRAAGLAAPAAAVMAAAPAAPLSAPPLVAQANGTARVAVRALAADGTLLGADTVEVIVRQIARAVQVAPASADLTPGDSIPVEIAAHDARGHRILDAAFQPVMAGAVWRDGRIVVPPTAPAGRATLAATVTGVAQPAQHAEAGVPDPAPDSSRVTVRVPAPAVAGDTATTAGNEVAARILDPAGRPVAGAWVRFRVPAGVLAGADSVQTDAQGLARARWTLPTAAGTYTATAVLLSARTPSDTAGLIVLRRTETVVAGAPAGAALVTAPPAQAALGGALAPAPVVQLVDRFGNPVALAGVPVTVAAGGPAGFTLGGPLTAATDAAGRASFPGLVGAGAAGPRPLAFTAAPGGQALAAVAAQVTFVAGAAQPGQTTVVLSAPSVASGSQVTATVTPRDAGGNPVGPGRTVTVALAAGTPGASTATASAVTDVGDGTYTATLTGVLAGAAAAVDATVDGTAVPGAPALTVTPGPLAHLAVLPATRTLTALGDTAHYTAAATDAAGNAVSAAGVTWTSGAAGVAPVAGAGSGGPAAATGVATAAANGTAVLTAALGGQTATAQVVVAQRAAALVRVAGHGLGAAVGAATDTAPAVRVTDANGHPVGGVSVTFAITAGGGQVNGAASQTVTTPASGVATAGPWVLGPAAGTNTLSATAAAVAPVSFTGTGHTTPSLSVPRVERMPGGTQQFAVAGGGPGPYVWLVGAPTGSPVAGGNATVGTVTAGGLYTAPASVPSPDSVRVCAQVAAAPAVRGCATVAIAATPTPGGDVVVLNDMNIVSSAASSGLEQSSGAYLRPENAQFATNLINFAGAGPRASQTRALFYLGAGSQCNAGFPCNPANPAHSLAGLVALWAGAGYASDTTTSLATIPANVKLVYILRPQTTLATAEINALKQFAAGGGRIVVQGEWINSYTAAGVAAENALVGALGSQLTNTGGAFLSTPSTGQYVNVSGAHQVLTGVTRLYFNATGGISAGANDLSLAREPGGTTVLGVTKVDPTPAP